MTKFKLFSATILSALIFGIGIFFGVVIAGVLAKTEGLNGYHCQPIQKVETLEEAKARIEQHQERVRGEI